MLIFVCLVILLSVHFDNLLRPTLLVSFNTRSATSTWGGSLRQGSYFVEFRHLQFSWSATTKYLTSFRSPRRLGSLACLCKDVFAARKYIPLQSAVLLDDVFASTQTFRCI